MSMVNTGEIVKVESQWSQWNGVRPASAMLLTLLPQDSAFLLKASSQTLSVGTSLPTVQTKSQSGNETLLMSIDYCLEIQIKYLGIQLEQFISIGLGGIIVSITEYGNGSEGSEGRRLSIYLLLHQTQEDLVKTNGNPFNHNCPLAIIMEKLHLKTAAYFWWEAEKVAVFDSQESKLLGVSTLVTWIFRCGQTGSRYDASNTSRREERRVNTLQSLLWYRGFSWVLGPTDQELWLTSLTRRDLRQRVSLLIFKIRIMIATFINIKWRNICRIVWKEPCFSVIK